MDNFTRFPNDILNSLIATRLSAIQITAVLYIVRKVNGWGKPSDRISIKKMAKDTGYSRRAMIAAVNDLEKMGVIQIDRNGIGRVSEMRVLSPEYWDKPVNDTSHVNCTTHVNATSQGGVNRSSQGGVNNTSHQRVNRSSHTKESKDTSKETIKETAPPDSLFIEEDLTDEELERQGWKIL